MLNDTFRSLGFAQKNRATPSLPPPPKQVGFLELLLHGVQLLDWAAHVCVYAALYFLGKYVLGPALVLGTTLGIAYTAAFFLGAFLEATGPGGSALVWAITAISAAAVYAKNRVPDNVTLTTVNRGSSPYEVGEFVKTALRDQAMESRRLLASRPAQLLVEPAGYNDSVYVSGSRLLNYEGLQGAQDAYWRRAEEANRNRPRGPFTED
jgi:hypothetical protein